MQPEEEYGSHAVSTAPAALTRLPIGMYRFHFRAEEPISLPAYAGSAWRGLFGHSLKRTVCVTRAQECSGCMLYRSCVYSYVFETPPPQDAQVMRKYTAAPHPFTLRIEPDAARQLASGDTFSLGLHLFGAGNRQLPYIAHALRTAGALGIGRARSRFALTGLEQFSDSRWHGALVDGERLELAEAQPPKVPTCPDGEVLLYFDTPLRLQRDGHLLRPQTLRFRDLFANLLRRLSMLSYFHGEGALAVDFAALVRASESLALDTTELRWHDWTRYSSRQKSTMQMGGLLGTARLDGTALAPFWPWLWLGQWYHAGKATSMGLGRYRMTAASLPAAPELVD